MKEIIDKLDPIQIKISTWQRANIYPENKTGTDGEKIIAKDISKKDTFDKGLWSKLYKELLKFNSKKMSNLT